MPSRDGPGGVLRRRALADEARRLVSTWFPGVDLVLDRPVIDLPMAERKVIEIVRAMRGDVRILILDEPTATLEAREKKRLWQIIRGLPQQGVGVVLISHFLSEVVELSDRITVLRDGAQVATQRRGEASEARLADLMLRREGAPGVAAEAASSASRPTDHVVLAVRNWVVGSVQVPRFEVRAGEIVGLIGLTGAGHFGFARSLFARQGLTSGEIEVDGRPVMARDVRAIRRAGIALVPDHRMENALAASGTVLENLSMVHPSYAARAGILNPARERREADRVIRLLNMTPTQRQLIKNLSGGNKQKVSIGMWLYGAEGRYRLLIFIEPTEGVDVGAKLEIYGHMRHLAGRGAAIVIASSGLGEIAQVCHRAIPFVHGGPGASIEAADFSEGRFIRDISGEAA